VEYLDLAMTFVCTCCCFGIHLFLDSVGSLLGILDVDHPSLVVAERIVVILPSSFGLDIQVVEIAYYLLVLLVTVVAFKVGMAYLGFLAVMGLLAAAT